MLEDDEIKYPAFPIKMGNVTYFGITEREYHASAFLQGIITSKGLIFLSSPYEREKYVKIAFELANEFLKESEKHR